MTEGRCLCGGVRFRITGELGPAFYCHCKQCQKESGSAFSSHALVRTEYWSFTAGEELVTEYESSPGEFRAFCSRCDSPIYGRTQGDAEGMRARLGTLDADPERRPLLHLWVSSKAPWHSISDALPQYREGYEPEGSSE